MKNTFTFLAASFVIASVGFASIDPKEAAVDKVTKCIEKGQLNDDTISSYFEIAEKGDISDEQALAISKIINRVKGCARVQLVLESVVAAKN